MLHWTVYRFPFFSKRDIFLNKVVFRSACCPFLNEFESCKVSHVANSLILCIFKMIDF